MSYNKRMRPSSKLPHFNIRDLRLFPRHMQVQKYMLTSITSQVTVSIFPFEHNPELFHKLYSRAAGTLCVTHPKSLLSYSGYTHSSEPHITGTAFPSAGYAIIGEGRLARTTLPYTWSPPMALISESPVFQMSLINSFIHFDQTVIVSALAKTPISLLP